MKQNANIGISLTNRKTGQSIATTTIIDAETIMDLSPVKAEAKIRKIVTEAVKDFLNKQHINLLTEDKQK